MKESSLKLYTGIRDCGFHSDDQLRFPQYDRSIQEHVESLGSPSYEERQDATRFLMQHQNSRQYLEKALLDTRPAVVKRVVEILDYLDFNELDKIFYLIGDGESISRLERERRGVRVFRQVNGRSYSEGEIPQSLLNLYRKAEVYKKIEINSLVYEIVSTGSETGSLPMSAEMSVRVRHLIIGIIDGIVAQRGAVENCESIFGSLKTIKWKDYDPRLRLDMLEAIYDSTPSIRHLREIEGGGLDARIFLGLHMGHSQTINMLGGMVRDSEFNDLYKKKFEKIKHKIVVGGDLDSLSEGGETLFFMMKFSGVFSLSDGIGYDSKDSPILAKLLSDVMGAVVSSDLRELRNLYLKNMDIIQLSEFTEEEMCIDLIISEARKYLHVFIDRVLRSTEISESEKSEILNSLYGFSSMTGELNLGDRDLEGFLKLYRNHLERQFLDCMQVSGDDWYLDVVRLASEKKSLDRFISFVWSLQNNAFPLELRKSFLPFLSQDPDKDHLDFSSLSRKDFKDLEQILKRFGGLYDFSPNDILATYQGLLEVENDLHGEFATRASTIAKHYRYLILGHFRAGDNIAFELVRDANEFLEEILK